MSQKPTAEEILRRILNSQEGNHDDFVASELGVTRDEIREALGLKKPGLSGDGINYASNHGSLLVAESDGGGMGFYTMDHSGEEIARPEVLRLWADLTRWLFGEGRRASAHSDPGGMVRLYGSSIPHNPAEIVAMLAPLLADRKHNAL